MIVSGAFASGNGGCSTDGIDQWLANEFAQVEAFLKKGETKNQ
jgi:hypothetical protein